VKTLQAYLTRQILASLLMTVAVFTFVLLLGSALKEILPYLLNNQVGFGTVAKATGLLIPFLWVFALPMGMLTATLLIFGRFSADQELTAARASGISLLSLISPILLLSLAFCTLSALITMEIGPRCRAAYTDMFDKVKVQLAGFQLPEGRYINTFPGFIVYVGKKHEDQLEDVWVFQLEQETNVVLTVHSRRGRVELDKPSNTINLYLYEGKILQADQNPGSFQEGIYPLRIDPAKSSNRSARIDDMTFSQLLDELHYREQLDRRISRSLSKDQLVTMKKDWERNRKGITPVMFQMHRQVAFSFACFGFTLLGIPLGIRVQRRETNIGIAIALVLVAFYYLFFLVGQSLDTRPDCAPYLIVWLPNFIFQAVGAVLLWRANRG
jgi:lipopolysaccharide export system permease protein